MKYIALILATVLLTGCGTYVTSRQKETAAQAMSDLAAASVYVENTYQGEVPALAAGAMRDHAVNMAKAMEIDIAELPKPRVTPKDWRDDPTYARQESYSNAKADGTTIEQYGLYAMTGVALAMIAGKAGMMMFGNHPIGQALGMLGQLFGGESPKQRKVYKKMLAILEEYKTVDPAWRDNRLYTMLSDRMTTAEKDFIKAERENV